MTIDFGCPNCGAPIHAPENAHGRIGTCVKCGHKLRVPDAQDLKNTSDDQSPTHPTSNTTTPPAAKRGSISSPPPPPFRETAAPASIVDDPSAHSRDAKLSPKSDSGRLVPGIFLGVLGIGGMFLAMVIFVFAQSHSPNLGFSEAVMKGPDHWVFKEPVYSLILLFATGVGLVSFAVGALGFILTIMVVANSNVSLMPENLAKQLKSR